MLASKRALSDFVEKIRDLLRAPFGDVAAFLVVELPVLDEAEHGCLAAFEGVVPRASCGMPRVRCPCNTWKTSAWSKFFALIPTMNSVLHGAPARKNLYRIG